MLSKYQKQGRLNEIGVRGELGFLYDAFERKYWYFEMIDMAHKLVVTSLIAFLPADYQMPIGLVVVYSYFACVMWCRPYFRKADDRLFLYTQAELVLLMLAAQVFFKHPGQNETITGVMVAVLICLVVFIYALFFIQAFHSMRKVYRKRKGLPIHEQKEEDRIIIDDVEMHAVQRTAAVKRLANNNDDGDTELQRNALWSAGTANVDQNSGGVEIQATINPLNDVHKEQKRSSFTESS
jgi:hypothetical protein